METRFEVLASRPFLPPNSMVDFLSRLARFACLALLLCGSVSHAQSDDVDPGFCVIRPDEPASAEIFEDHNGQRFYFCCESCRQDFLNDPSRFDGLGVGHEIQPIERTYNPSNSFEHTFWGRVGRAFLMVQGWGHHWSETLQLRDPINVALIAIAAIVGLAMLKRLRSRRRNQTESIPHPMLARFGLPVAVIALLSIAFYAAALRRDLYSATTELADTTTERDRLQKSSEQARHKDLVHYATFLNHGIPPRPLPSKLPRSLKKTYFRGNDERSDEMFNGGNYRTVTFHTWLEDAAGKPLDYGDVIFTEEGEPIELSVHVQFVRSPDTSSGYFTEKYMKRMYLTKSSGEFLGRDEPVPDRVDWVMSVENRQWEGVIRINPPSEETLQSRDGIYTGIVYLCEDRYEGSKMIGGRFHYAIEYRLLTEDGKLSAESDLWMGATYRGRAFAELQIENEEWLSLTPLPEKPE